MSITSKHTRGFTVVIVAALFVAMAVIAAAVVERNSTLQQITRRDATRDQLRKLSNAIIEYSVFNRNGSGVNLYPCPALLSLGPSSATFGASVYSGGGYAQNCSSTTGDAGSATADGLTILGTDIIMGMVPVLELSSYGIGIGDAFDPWNSRILYVVNRTQTRHTSVATSNTNNPTLMDPRTSASGSETFIKPDFILISLGRDRVGATPRGSGAGALTVGSCAASALPRYENCDNDTTFVTAPTYVASGADATGAYSGTSYFDDILVWHRQ